MFFRSEYDITNPYPLRAKRGLGGEGEGVTTAKNQEATASL